jgi:hypothetical protein
MRVTVAEAAERVERPKTPWHKQRATEKQPLFSSL